MANQKILIVEDDTTLLDVLKYNLEKEGFEVVTAGDGVKALEEVRTEQPSMIILDIMLPNMDGYEVCRIVRSEMTVPILMLTAKAGEIDKVVGLEIGADDYMTKPFSTRELMARIRALLRRSVITRETTAEDVETVPTLKSGNLELDISRHEARVDNRNIDLSPKEFDLLAYLMKHKGKVYNRDFLLKQIWDYEYSGDSRTIDVHIRWLRKKIEIDPDHPERIITLRGVGYKFEQ
jgi:two-component system, OmpR family, response regulator